MRTHFSIHRRRTAHNHIITQCSHNLPIKFKVPHFVFLSHPSRPNSQTQPTPAHSFSGSQARSVQALSQEMLFSLSPCCVGLGWCPAAPSVVSPLMCPAAL